MIRSASTGEEEAAGGVGGGGGLAVGSFCFNDEPPPCAFVNKSIKVELWGKVEVAGAAEGVGAGFGFDFFLDRLG